jgi:hypothetical protein
MEAADSDHNTREYGQEYYDRWAKILTQGNEIKEKRLEKILKSKNGDSMVAIMEYRRQLFESGKCGKGKLEGYVETIGDISKVLEYLQNMFLEPVTKEYFFRFRKLKVKNGWTFGKIIQEHEKHPTKRLLSIVQCKCK